MHRCKTELKSQDKVMQEDLSNMATHPKSKRRPCRGYQVWQSSRARKKKCDAIGRAYRSEPDVVGAEKSASLEESQYAVHHKSMEDNQAVVAAVEKYLLEGAAKLKAAMKGSSGDEPEPSAEAQESPRKS